MNRTMRRTNDQKRYSYNDAVKIAGDMLLVKVDEIKKNYDVVYTLCLISSLATEPYRFGKKRICDITRLFFDQVEGVLLKTIDIDQLTEIAKSKGVRLEHKNGKFIVDIDTKEVK